MSYGAQSQKTKPANKTKWKNLCQPRLRLLAERVGDATSAIGFLTKKIRCGIVEGFVGPIRILANRLSVGPDEGWNLGPRRGPIRMLANRLSVGCAALIAISVTVAEAGSGEPSPRRGSRSTPSPQLLACRLAAGEAVAFPHLTLSQARSKPLP